MCDEIIYAFPNVIGAAVSKKGLRGETSLTNDGMLQRVELTELQSSSVAICNIT